MECELPRFVRGESSTRASLASLRYVTGSEDGSRRLFSQLSIGRHTRIAPGKYLRERTWTIVIDEYEGLFEIKNYLIDFRPESVYYDRNVYKDWDQAKRVGNDATRLGRAFGQELVLDVDPENFTCPIHGTLEDKMRKHQGSRSVGSNSNWQGRKLFSS